MSRHSSHERSVTIGDAEFLSVIREEQCSPAMSANLNDIAKRPCSKSSSALKCCACKTEKVMLENDEISNILAEKEIQLRYEYNQKFEEEIAIMKERFDFILQNEQVRTSYMLMEAHRERKEKITALQNQLECKNLAALMYVLATERRKSRLEKLRIVEEYTNHITALQTLLAEGQGLILDLSRGYKTASKVDHEWRVKMKKVVEEFQNFIYAFAGSEEACNQYFFDLPALLKTEASLQNDPKEDPCVTEEASVVEEGLTEPEDNAKGTWWQRLQSECRPFVVFGDMDEFKPPQRRAVLKVVKAAKTAPRKWKDYVFNEMFLQADCPNLNSIKNEYPNQLHAPSNWECRDGTSARNQSESSRRVTPPSLDTRTTMGSIFKIITATSQQGGRHHENRDTLLGARDSMEIASSTKILREKRNSSRGDGKVILNIRDRTASIFQDYDDEDEEDNMPQKIIPPPKEPKPMEDDDAEDEQEENSSRLGSIHHDSLEVLQHHVPDKDAKINYEKVCPMDQCKRMQMDSFVRSLPPYMRANPFTHFEQDFEGYEACSPEQLKILQQRIELKKKKQRKEVITESDPLEEWEAHKDVGGVGIQTSVDSMFPPCTCAAPSPTPASSVSNDYGHVYTMEELIPVKQMLDKVHQDCLYDSGIEFDRFKVIGQQIEHETKSKGDYGRNKFEEIKRILEQHPSLCDIFQGNTQC